MFLKRDWSLYDNFLSPYVGYPELWRFCGVQARASGICWATNPDTYTIEDFKRDFPEFFKEDEDTGELEPLFPLSLFESVFKVANSIVQICSWGENWEYGMGLVIAHLLILKLRKRNNGTLDDLINGSVTSGLVKSAQLGDASLTYDASYSANADYGAWNETPYGQEFIEFVRHSGLGGMYALL